MTLAIGCILVAALLPFVTVGMAKYKRGYDNNAPREWEANLKGWRQRAVAAHQNHFEAFAPFAAGVIVAQLARVPQGAIDVIVVVFVAARIAYTAAYIADKGILRSTIWMVGLACTIALYASAMSAR
ncbi:hypothetical protein BWI17_03105 [Betaproteobacteria bacterium GR16-43]|nr:hypothetical protein BWI17_03105 [Betaproteobacteria bacterium GR16-43]